MREARMSTAFAQIDEYMARDASRPQFVMA